MARKKTNRSAYETSLTATLDRQWDYSADSIIRQNLDLSDDEIVELIRAKNCSKTAEWVRSRRGLFSKPSTQSPTS